MKLFGMCLAVWFVLGCGGSPIPQQNASDFSRYSTIARAISEAGTPVLYEGLPHPMREPGHFEKERKREDILEWKGHWFYREQIALDKKLAVELTKLVTENGTFAPFTGEKKCGGFHPDFALKWVSEEGSYACFLCFGCQEALFFTPQTELRCDMTKESAKKFASLLTIRKNRPGERDFILID